MKINKRHYFVLIFIIASNYGCSQESSVIIADDIIIEDDRTEDDTTEDESVYKDRYVYILRYIRNSLLHL